jgi:hypothetical protein
LLFANRPRDSLDLASNRTLEVLDYSSASCQRSHGEAQDQHKTGKKFYVAALVKENKKQALQGKDCEHKLRPEMPLSFDAEKQRNNQKKSRRELDEIYSGIPM